MSEAQPSERVSFAGKTALITGSSAGWGMGVAIGLAERGANVVVNGRTRKTVDAVVDRITTAGGSALGVVGDVSNSSEVQRFVDETRNRFGRLDIMVNNAAGSSHAASVVDMTDEQWASSLGIALNGVFYGTRSAARAMIEQGQGGRIINIGGYSGVWGLAYKSDSAVAKGGVLAGTWGWAVELASHGITVNSVRASVLGAASTYHTIKERFESEGKPVPQPRDLGIFDPSDAATPVIWLASDAAANVTGRFFGIDGPRLQVWRLAEPSLQLFHEPFWDVETLDSVLPSIIARLPPNPSPADQRPHLIDGGIGGPTT